MITQSPTAGAVFTGINTIHTIVLTAEDESGNAEMCSFQIQLIDEIPPSITCPNNQLAMVNGCDYRLPDFSTEAIIADNCSAPANIMITQSPMPDIVFTDTGIYEITLTATDESGNSSQCSFFVELEIAFPALPSIFGN